MIAILTGFFGTALGWVVMEMMLRRGEITVVGCILCLLSLMMILKPSRAFFFGSFGHEIQDHLKEAPTILENITVADLNQVGADSLDPTSRIPSMRPARRPSFSRTKKKEPLTSWTTSIMAWISENVMDCRASEERSVKADIRSAGRADLPAIQSIALNPGISWEIKLRSAPTVISVTLTCICPRSTVFSSLTWPPSYESISTL